MGKHTFPFRIKTARAPILEARLTALVLAEAVRRSRLARLVYRRIRKVPVPGP